MKKVLYGLLFVALAGFSSCIRDTDSPLPSIKAPKGVLVLSEGNFSDGTGKLGFVSAQGIYTDSLYYRANGQLLGNVAQDLFVSANKLYIITQNGDKNGGKGMLIVANASTYKSLKVYGASDLSALAMPTNIAVVAPYVYIRDSKGIYALNETTNTLTYITGTDGATGVSMTTLGGIVYALGERQVYGLKDGKLASTTDLGTTLSGVQRTSDGQLWLSAPDTKQIIKFDPTTGAKQVHGLGSAEGIGKGWGHRSAIATTGDTIYFCNAGLKLYRHIFGQNETKQVADISALEPRLQIYYNSLAVDPETGYVYFAGLKSWAEYKTSNNILVLDPKTNYTVKYNLAGHTAFPAGVFPLASF